MSFWQLLIWSWVWSILMWGQCYSMAWWLCWGLVRKTYSSTRSQKVTFALDVCRFCKNIASKCSYQRLIQQPLKPIYGSLFLQFLKQMCNFHTNTNTSNNVIAFCQWDLICYINNVSWNALLTCKIPAEAERIRLTGSLPVFVQQAAAAKTIRYSP